MANMIRLCPEVHSEVEDYQKKIIEFYENETLRLQNITYLDARDVKAHFFDSHSVQRFPKSDKLVLLEGHFQQYEQSILDGKFPYNPKCFWLIVAFPNWDSLPGKRIRAMNFWPQNPNYYTIPFNFFVNNKITATDENGTLFDSEILFTDQGSEYLRTELRKFDLELPASADILHRHWIGWMRLIENCPPLFDPN